MYILGVSSSYLWSGRLHFTTGTSFFCLFFFCVNFQLQDFSYCCPCGLFDWIQVSCLFFLFYLHIKHRTSAIQSHWQRRWYKSWYWKLMPYMHDAHKFSRRITLLVFKMQAGLSATQHTSNLPKYRVRLWRCALIGEPFHKWFMLQIQILYQSANHRMPAPRETGGGLSALCILT